MQEKIACKVHVQLPVCGHRMGYLPWVVVVVDVVVVVVVVVVVLVLVVEVVVKVVVPAGKGTASR